MASISDHAKERSIERIEEVTSVSKAKRYARQARVQGKAISHYVRYPRFFHYLQNKNNQTRTTRIKIYKDYIYIWRGETQTLVTVHPIPDRYKEEMEAIDNGKSRE